MGKPQLLKLNVFSECAYLTSNLKGSILFPVDSLLRGTWNIGTKSSGSDLKTRTFTIFHLHHQAVVDDHLLVVHRTERCTYR